MPTNNDPKAADTLAPAQPSAAVANAVAASTESQAKPSFDAVQVIASEMSLRDAQVGSVVKLLLESNTVPFIARYRKEVTGGLDEVQIRAIEERHAYLLELAERRQTVLASIQDQGKLTPALKAQILACTTKATLEDLYLPFKPKRRTRATIAKEKGLLPLAELILSQAEAADPEAVAAQFITQAAPSDGQEKTEEDKEKAKLRVADAAEALAGARDIVAEKAAEHAEIRATLRNHFATTGILASKASASLEKDKPTKYEQYYTFSESGRSIPSHRYLALRRGEREGVLRVRIEVDPEPCMQAMREQMEYNPKSPWSRHLDLALHEAYERLLSASIETDIRVDIKKRADKEAVEVFAQNLDALLLSSPLGSQAVLGVDPGLRTGCKCAMVDATGKFIEEKVFYLHKEGRKAEAQTILLDLVARHRPGAIAIGNGTGGRETEAFVRRTLREAFAKKTSDKDDAAKPPMVVSVNEAGASVYSASDVAREEFPKLDLTVRGAISIARRLQDPLAELVKIDPKSIGVGQYQHDVHQPMLQRKLGEVVETCVNKVGVELNTASAPLLSYVAGIGQTLAKSIVRYREEHGAIADRQALHKIPGMGPKTFEQAAGFIRIRQSKNPLDHSAVHPERYPLIAKMAEDLGVSVQALVGDEAMAAKIDTAQYVSDDVGQMTLRDIIDELGKPGRDPRASFEPPKFRDDVCEVEDLVPEMDFEGVVTNVTAFGAFVDVGVHQDGLVHISELAEHFVRDASEVVKVGDRLHVWVLGVDVARKRIALSAKRPQARNAAAEKRSHEPNNRDGQQQPRDTKRPRDQQRPRNTKNARPSSPRKEGGRGGFSNNPFAKLGSLR